MRNNVLNANAIFLLWTKSFCLDLHFMTAKQNIYFNNLDAFRFFAFLKVFLLHLPYSGKSSIIILLKSGGGLGVLFFFVLSGFLITFKACNEISSTQQFQAKRFFINRALRIWPLFFLVLIVVHLIPYDFLTQLGMHIIAHGYLPNPWYSFSFLENYRMIHLDNVPQTSPLSVFWSLCIEEHFYIVWILMFSFVSIHKIKYFLWFGIIIGVVSRFFEGNITHNQHVLSNDLITNLDLFCIGGLLGYAYIYNKVYLISIYRRISSKGKWVSIVFLMLAVLFFPWIRPTQGGNFWKSIFPFVYGVLFVIPIWYSLFANKRFLISKNQFLSKLGNLSYGLYVYHLIFIHILLKICQNNNIEINTTTTLVLFGLACFILSVGLSYLSYRYFESIFIKLKRKIRSE